LYTYTALLGRQAAKKPPFPQEQKKAAKIKKNGNPAAVAPFRALGPWLCVLTLSRGLPFSVFGYEIVYLR